MPEYLTPGVYIEEIERGPRPIEGVPTSTAAFIGETERGTTWPQPVTSYQDYRRLFGDTWNVRDRYLPHAVNGFFENGGKRAFVCRCVGEGAVTATRVFGDYTVSALGAGAWGNNVWVRISRSSTEEPVPGAPGTQWPVGFRVKIAYWSTIPQNFQPFDPFLERTKSPRPTIAEDFDDLSIDPDSSDFYEKRLRDKSVLTEIEWTGGTPASLPADGEGLLEYGLDDPNPVGRDDYVGEPSGNRTEAQGLAALTLDPFREVALVHAPYPPTQRREIAQAVIAHCESLRFRFAVLDCERAVSSVESPDLDPRTSIQDTSYAALYYPWLDVSDPLSGSRVRVPPGDYVLGVYARTDTERGVFKAPVNEVVHGALDLEFDIDDGRQATLNPRGVNVIRRFPVRGICIWGARTLSSDGLWKYVPVRRLFIFLERSIYEGTQWVVFEPNDERLWARVKDTIRLFLRTQWRLGALVGNTEEQAFFITCDRTTMTQDDILNGRLICEIGIAPVRPAEFVIFRIFQNTAEAQR
jgi:phage tail sheath protein FI